MLCDDLERWDGGKGGSRGREYVCHVCEGVSACRVCGVCARAHVSQDTPFPGVGREPLLGCNSPAPSQLGGQPPSSPTPAPWRNRLCQKVHSRDTHLPAQNWKHWGKRIFADRKLSVLAALYHITKEAHSEASAGPGVGCHCRCPGGHPPGQSGWGPDTSIRVSVLGLTPLSRELGCGSRS